MGLTIIPAVVDATAVQQAAADALAAAQNARQMVLNRDPTIASLQQALANVQTTPGPQGPAGLTGAKGATGNAGPAGSVGATGTAGATGATGATGSTGATGPAGTANLVVGMGPIGLLALGGSTTLTIPWARTLTTAPANVMFAHSAVVSLANVGYSNIVVTTTGVTVKVQSIGLALAAGTLFAMGW